MGRRRSCPEWRSTILPTDDLLPKIRAWVESTRDVDLPIGLSVDQYLRRAAGLIERLRTKSLESQAAELEADAEAPDVLHAVCELLDGDRDSDTPESEGDLSRSYRLVSHVSWHDDFGERDQMLARLSFLAWNHWRKTEDYPKTQTWQSRCTQHVVAQEHVRQFLALPPSERSARLNRRFLGDEAVLLTLCTSLEERRDSQPAIIAREGTLLYQWLLRDGMVCRLREELVHFLAAKVALSVTFAEYRLGREKNRRSWSERAQFHARRCSGAGPLMAMIEYARLAGAFGGRAFARVSAECPSLIRRFEALRMNDKALRARFLRGRAMKELGEWKEALVWMEQVHAEAVRSGDIVAAALALCDSAEILSGQGRYEDGMTACKEAVDLARRCDCGWVVANVQGTLGELLRDNGHLSSSIEAYAASLVSYETLEMWPLAAYSRVLIAETLLMAGRPHEAAVTVLAALPVIERENLTQEAVAAIGILREAIRRQQANPEALRKLREQLQLMKAEGGL